jgi:uncharacterized membrane protein (UPF0127 family)
MTAVARTLLFVLAFATFALGAGADEDFLPLSAFARTTVRIETPSGRVHAFDVYVARSEREHMQGLMNVESLPENDGMIFPFDPPRQVSMWMKNTLIPLDMVFIREDGRIANVIADAAPQSLDTRPSDGTVAYVLELNGGTAARLGIVPGARVHVAPIDE